MSAKCSGGYFGNRFLIIVMEKVDALHRALHRTSTRGIACNSPQLMVCRHAGH